MSASSLSIEVDGEGLSIDELDAVVDVRVISSAEHADRSTVRLRDPYFELVDAERFPIGARFVASLPDDDSPSIPAFVGRIVDLHVEPGDDGRHEVSVTAVDDRHASGGREIGESIAAAPIRLEWGRDVSAFSVTLPSTSAEGSATLRGSCDGRAALRVGSRVELDGAGRRMSGRWRVVAATHVIGANMPFTTHFTCVRPIVAGPTS